jgi:acyl dehydratase
MGTAVDPRERFLDEFSVGETFEYGTVTVTEEDIIEFGRKFDRQPFHIDPVAAADGPFGGLIAAGWHTCTLAGQLLTENMLVAPNCLGSLGVDRLRLPAPVRPDAKLRTRITVADVKPSNSKPDRGVLTCDQEVFDVRDPDAPLTVLTLTGMVLWRRQNKENDFR